MKKRYTTLALLAAVLLSGRPTEAQTTSKKIVLQAFWWDYYNDTYRFKWADYLTELAPRLKSLGIDAVWIPPTPKNKNATNDVGYSPFDHYDLGDKYQKGDTRTRFGSKDEFLRMVAVLHANGIEVIQDVVLNHADGAGTNTGEGGQDPDAYSMQSNAGYKTFRYPSFSTPLPQTSGENAAEYLSRNGRWPKNYANFHPHLGHNTTSGDQAAPYFGPDFCYGGDAGSDGLSGPDGYGGLSGAITSQFPNAFNPTQSAGYSRNQARNWIVWMKKQTGVDGFRWDAVKHFSYAVQQDLSYNLKYNAGWANGGETMFNVGEYVGGKGDLDSYTSTANAQNNGNDFLIGTFDFGLRDGLYSMVYGSGGFDMGSLPGRQQDQRVAYYSNSNTYVHRTVPFVNNHDTFRPQTNSTGNYTGWNTGSELAPHIDPFEPRLSAAYAVALSMDGSPQIFFEDLFNLGSTGKRYAHEPSSTSDLPVRSDLENLIWCHQHLDFKSGAYRVRAQQADHLVLERSAKALIGINDNWDTWQTTWVDSDFAPGTVLKDYSGANGSATYTVPNDKRVPVNTPPCNGTAAGGRRGYSVWAPVGQDASQYQPPRAALTTQEWEMADDLGDLNCNSLGQGGALPSNSTNSRLVGKIYVQAGRAVRYDLFPGNSPNFNSLTVGLYDLRGNLLSSASGTASASGTYTPAFTGWYALKVRNTAATYAGQRCYVKVRYTAPAVVNTRLANVPRNEVAIWTGNNNSSDPGDCRNWENGVEPAAAVDALVPAGTSLTPALSLGSLAVRNLTIESGATLTLAAGTVLHVSGNLVVAGALAGEGRVELEGGIEQTLSSGSISTPLTLANLTLNNADNVRLLSPLSVSSTLVFNAGNLVLDNYNLSLGTNATITGADASHYVVTPDVAASGGFVLRPVPTGSAAVEFPVGTAASYTPLTLANSGTSTTFRVRTFSGQLTNGTSGAPYARTAEFVNRTWEVTPDLASGPIVTMTLQFGAADQNASFDRSKAHFYRNEGGAGSGWSSIGAATLSGSGPYVATHSDIAGFSKFSLGNAVTPLPVTLTEFGAKRSSASSVRLSWATAQEKNNAGFEVEKSADGRAFEQLTTLPARGGSQRTSYQYLDTKASGAAYYRLRLRDQDGSSQLSPVAFVAAAGAPYTLVPNPSHGETLQLLGGPVADEAQPLRVSLTSVLGRVVLAPAPAGREALAAQLSAALAKAAPGVYVLTITSADGGSQRLRVVRE
jgi:alpha-amylase